MAKRKPKPHVVFKDDQERIAELKLCLETVHEMLFNLNPDCLAVSRQCYSMIKAVLTWFEQDQKYLTQMATAYNSLGGLEVIMVEELVIIHKGK